MPRYRIELRDKPTDQKIEWDFTDSGDERARVKAKYASKFMAVASLLELDKYDKPIRNVGLV